MGGPSYEPAVLDAYFRALDPSAWDDPIVGPVLRRLAVEAPDVIAAVADVDRSLIEDALARSPEERFRRTLAAAASIERTRRAMGTADG